MSTLRRGAPLLIGACFCVAAALPGAAQDLPWPDANPLQSIDRPTRPAPAETRRAPASPRVVETPAAETVPVPEARPDGADDSPTADEPAATEAASPARRDAAPDLPTDGQSAAEVPATEAPATEAPAEAIAAEEPADPPAVAASDDADAADITGTPPTGDIPTPETRPKRAADQPSEPSMPTQSAPDATPDVPEPDAPAPEMEPGPDARPAEPGAPATPDAPSTPPALGKLEQKVSPEASVLAAAAIADAVACEAELAGRGVVFTVGPSISEGACGVLRPVSVAQLSSGIAVTPQTQLLCRTALALDEWMSSSVVPAARVHLSGRALTEFRHGSTYVCRKRASERGISEHARGSAVDISAFVFDEGPEIAVEAQKPGSPEALFQRAVREGACGPFRTVLGPGTDADHATHFHLDIAARRNEATYCR